ncbi:MAG: 3'(2'),5'-bisphosphate nucleotidase CysQ, partial [Gammaproteobacteria bacterium]|nr:3'(2'),5'-bisphosphate nucleotidase CysQ [Gammaproteobacteria bacterium]
MDVYATDFNVETKSDSSPVTEADLRAHAVIVDGLQRLSPVYPILSEESSPPDFDTRRTWSRYWLVDPLDGTKEFVGRNGEFTVNIALIEGHRPVLGVVGVPTQDKVFVGDVVAQEAYKETGAGRERLA